LKIELIPYSPFTKARKKLSYCPSWKKMGQLRCLNTLLIADCWLYTTFIICDLWFFKFEYFRFKNL